MLRVTREVHLLTAEESYSENHIGFPCGRLRRPGPEGLETVVMYDAGWTRRCFRGRRPPVAPVGKDDQRTPAPE